MGGSVSMVDGHIDEVLKPCPFCGGRAYWRHIGDGKTTLRTHRIYCGNECCPIEPKTHWYCDEGTAIRYWNRRVSR